MNESFFYILNALDFFAFLQTFLMHAKLCKYKQVYVYIPNPGISDSVFDKIWDLVVYHNNK